MSLNHEERRRTIEELVANATASGLTSSHLARDLGFTEDRLHAALDVDSTTDPVEVWLLRDYLNLAVRAAGREPRPYTVLTDAARAQARQWFALRTPPRPSTTEATTP